MGVDQNDKKADEVTNVEADTEKVVKVDCFDMEIDESEMIFPIKSEECVYKERKLVVNGALFYEKRKAIEVCDGSGTKFLSIGILRKIEDKIYKTSELFKNGKSEGQKCNLGGDEKQQFESEWKENWKSTDSNLEAAQRHYDTSTDNTKKE